MRLGPCKRPSSLLVTRASSDPQRGGGGGGWGGWGGATNSPLHLDTYRPSIAKGKDAFDQCTSSLIVVVVVVVVVDDGGFRICPILLELFHLLIYQMKI